MPAPIISNETYRRFFEASKPYATGVVNRIRNEHGNITRAKIDRAGDMKDTLKAWARMHPGQTIKADAFLEFYLKDLELNCILGTLPNHLLDNFTNWKKAQPPVTIDDRAQIAKDSADKLAAMIIYFQYCQLIYDELEDGDADKAKLKQMFENASYREADVDMVPWDSLSGATEPSQVKLVEVQFAQEDVELPWNLYVVFNRHDEVMYLAAQYKAHPGGWERIAE